MRRRSKRNDKRPREHNDSSPSSQQEQSLSESPSKSPRTGANTNEQPVQQQANINEQPVSQHQQSINELLQQFGGGGGGSGGFNQPSFSPPSASSLATFAMDPMVAQLMEEASLQPAFLSPVVAPVVASGSVTLTPTHGEVNSVLTPATIISTTAIPMTAAAAAADGSTTTKKKKKKKAQSLTKVIIDAAVEWKKRIGRPERRTTIIKHDHAEERKKTLGVCNELNKNVRALEIFEGIRSCVESSNHVDSRVRAQAGVIVQLYSSTHHAEGKNDLKKKLVNGKFFEPPVDWKKKKSKERHLVFVYGKIVNMQSERSAHLLESTRNSMLTPLKETLGGAITVELYMSTMVTGKVNVEPPQRNDKDCTLVDIKFHDMHVRNVIETLMISKKKVERYRKVSEQSKGASLFSVCYDCLELC